MAQKKKNTCIDEITSSWAIPQGASSAEGNNPLIIAFGGNVLLLAINKNWILKRLTGSLRTQNPNASIVAARFNQISSSAVRKLSAYLRNKLKNSQTMHYVGVDSAVCEYDNFR